MNAISTLAARLSISNAMRERPAGILASVSEPGLARAALSQSGERTVGRLTVDDDDDRRAYELANGLEAGQRIVVQLSQMRGDKKCGRSDQQGAAVGRGAGYSFGSDDCTRTRAVLGQ